MKTLVGIPTLNGPDRLRRCLQAIRSETPSDNTMVIFVADDGSEPSHLEANKSVCLEYGIELIFGHGRTGIAATWNRLIRHVPDAEIIVLLNDDVEVVRDWLDVLRYTIGENPEIGCVSLPCWTGILKPSVPAPHIDYVESRLQDGGGTLLSAGGAIFAFRRMSWSMVGGFDERYFVFYEEIDFNVSLARMGRFNFVVSYPVVFHLGGATNSDPRNLSAGAHILQSRQRFLDKWGKCPDELRCELARRSHLVGLKEWNSQLKFLKD